MILSAQTMYTPLTIYAMPSPRNANRGTSPVCTLTTLRDLQPGSITAQNLTDRERATVLAALRMWQRLGVGQDCPEQDIANNDGDITPTLDSDIDALCERLNDAPIKERILATPAERDAAIRSYVDDDCEIDDDAAVSRGDDVTWVQAWVRIAPA